MRHNRLVLYGYTRDTKGVVTNYHPKKVSGVIHTLTGRGWTTDQFVGVIYET